MSPTATRRVVTVLFSAVVWVALWGDLTLGNVAAGLVVGLFAVWVVPVQRTSRGMPLRPVAQSRYLLFFVWALVKSSAVVAWEVVTPGSRIHEGIVAVPLRTDTPGVITIIADSISLTPGTLTIEVRHQPTVLYVHVLHLRSFEDARAEIAHLEELAIAAFEPDAAANEGSRA